MVARSPSSVADVDTDDVGPATADPGSPKRSRGYRHLLGSILPPVLIAALVIAAWYFATYVVLDTQRRFLLPPPDAVITNGFLDHAVRTEILVATYHTAVVALLGLVIAAVVGIAVAIAMVQAPWVERSLFPWAVVLQTVPILAIVPLIGFWFGFDFRSRVLVCVLISLFPMITSTLFGLRSPPQGLHDVFSLRRANRWTRLWKLQFPSALPAIFVGLQTCAGLAVIGAIVGDYFFRQGQPGIGRLLDNYRAELLSAQLFAAVAASSLLGIAAFAAVGLVRDRVVGSWHESARGRK